MRARDLAILAGVLALAAGGCGGESPEPAASPAVTPATAPANPPGITLGNARIQLPAVSGRPGVAYFTVAQSNGAARAITAVTVAMVGRTEIHETMQHDGASAMEPLAKVPIGPGRNVAFEPGGKHVMLFDLDPKLRFSDEAELTVTFDNGDKAVAGAEVVTVNEAMEGMD